MTSPRAQSSLSGRTRAGRRVHVLLLRPSGIAAVCDVDAPDGWAIAVAPVDCRRCLSKISRAAVAR